MSKIITLPAPVPVSPVIKESPTKWKDAFNRAKINYFNEWFATFDPPSSVRYRTGNVSNEIFRSSYEKMLNKVYLSAASLVRETNIPSKTYVKPIVGQVAWDVLLAAKQERFKSVEMHEEFYKYADNHFASLGNRFNKEDSTAVFAQFRVLLLNHWIATMDGFLVVPSIFIAYLLNSSFWQKELSNYYDVLVARTSRSISRKAFEFSSDSTTPVSVKRAILMNLTLVHRLFLSVFLDFQNVDDPLTDMKAAESFAGNFQMIVREIILKELDTVWDAVRVSNIRKSFIVEPYLSPIPTKVTPSLIKKPSKDVVIVPLSEDIVNNDSSEDHELEWITNPLTETSLPPPTPISPPLLPPISDPLPPLPLPTPININTATPIINNNNNKKTMKKEEDVELKMQVEELESALHESKKNDIELMLRSHLKDSFFSTQRLEQLVNMFFWLNSEEINDDIISKGVTFLKTLDQTVAGWKDKLALRLKREIKSREAMKQEQLLDEFFQHFKESNPSYPTYAEFMDNNRDRLNSYANAYKEFLLRTFISIQKENLLVEGTLAAAEEDVLYNFETFGMMFLGKPRLPTNEERSLMMPRSRYADYESLSKVEESFIKSILGVSSSANPFLSSSKIWTLFKENPNFETLRTLHGTENENAIRAIFDAHHHNYIIEYMESQRYDLEDKERLKEAVAHSYEVYRVVQSDANARMYFSSYPAPIPIVNIDLSNDRSLKQSDSVTLAVFSNPRCCVGEKDEEVNDKEVREFYSRISSASNFRNIVRIWRDSVYFKPFLVNPMFYVKNRQQTDYVKRIRQYWQSNSVVESIGSKKQRLNTPLPIKDRFNGLWIADMYLYKIQFGAAPVTFSLYGVDAAVLTKSNAPLKSSVAAAVGAKPLLVAKATDSIGTRQWIEKENKKIAEENAKLGLTNEVPSVVTQVSFMKQLEGGDPIGRFKEDVRNGFFALTTYYAGDDQEIKDVDGVKQKIYKKDSNLADSLSADEFYKFVWFFLFDPINSPYDVNVLSDKKMWGGYVIPPTFIELYLFSDDQTFLDCRACHPSDHVVPLHVWSFMTQFILHFRTRFTAYLASRTSVDPKDDATIHLLKKIIVWWLFCTFFYGVENFTDKRSRFVYLISFNFLFLKPS